MKKLLLAGLAMLGLLSGCLFPERFTSTITFRDDGSYSAEFDGTVAHLMAVMAIADRGKLSPNEEQGLQQQFDSLAKTPGISKAKYKGNGRADLAFNFERKRGQPVNLFDMIQVGTNKAGNVFVTAPPYKESDGKQLAKLKLDIKGELVVKLPKNAEVIETNAHSKPGFFSSNYSWQIQKADQRPMMVINFK